MNNKCPSRVGPVCFRNFRDQSRLLHRIECRVHTFAAGLGSVYGLGDLDRSHDSVFLEQLVNLRFHVCFTKCFLGMVLNMERVLIIEVGGYSVSASGTSCGTVDEPPLPPSFYTFPTTFLTPEVERALETPAELYDRWKTAPLRSLVGHIREISTPRGKWGDVLIAEMWDYASE